MVAEVTEEMRRCAIGARKIQNMNEKQCEKCRGDGSNPTEKVYRGRIVYEKCKECDGKGFIPANEKLTGGGKGEKTWIS